LIKYFKYRRYLYKKRKENAAEQNISSGTVCHTHVGCGSHDTHSRLGQTPVYNGETPTKIDETDTYKYVFSGWSPDVTAKTSTGARVTLSGEWMIPEGAEILESGVARVHVSDPDGITKEYIYEHGIKKFPGIQYRNVKMTFSINLNKTAAQKKICAVTYVKYKMGNKEFTSISDVKFA